MKVLRNCVVFIFLFFLTLSITHKSVFAAKFGVNIAGKHGDFDQAVKLVGKGGWIVVMSPPTSQVLDWVNKAAKDEVNLIIRASHPGDNNFSGYAERWARLFRDIPAGQFVYKIYFVPVNEPNNPQEGLTCAGVQPYVQEVLDFFSEYGLRGARVDVLSPALDAYRLADNNMDCFNQMGGTNYFKQFDGIVFHAYGQVNNDGSLQTDAHPFKKGDVPAFLSAMGLPTSTPVYIVETAVLCPGCAEVDEGGKSLVKYPFTQKYKDMILGYWDAVKDLWNAANVKAFTPISYDPPDYGRSSWINSAGDFGQRAQALIGGGESDIVEAGELTPGQGGAGSDVTPVVATPCDAGEDGFTCAVADKAPQAVSFAQTPTDEACNVVESFLSYFGLVDCELEKVDNSQSPQATISSADKGFFETIFDTATAWVGFGEKSDSIKTNIMPYSVAGASTTEEEAISDEASSEKDSCEALNLTLPLSMQSDCGT